MQNWKMEDLFGRFNYAFNCIAIVRYGVAVIIAYGDNIMCKSVPAIR